MRATQARREPVAIKKYLDSLVANGALDIDSDGVADALTDGLLVLRNLPGICGSALIANAVAMARAPSRMTAAETENFLFRRTEERSTRPR